MRTMRSLLALAFVLAAPAALADTVEATSTTYISAGKQTRGGLPGQSPDLVNVMPVVEVISVAAHGIRNPVFENLDVVVSTWGAFDLQDRRWDAGTSDNLTGDVMTGYVRGQLFSRRLTLRLGRENVAIGAGRVASIDGGDVALRLPLGLGLTAYAGAPVAQRFSARDASSSWNALGGDFAYGGRASLAIPLPSRSSGSSRPAARSPSSTTTARRSAATRPSTPASACSATSPSTATHCMRWRMSGSPR